MAFYTKEKLEFLTVAVETCRFLEQMQTESKHDFVVKTVRLLPLLYLKAQMLPASVVDEDLERFVTEVDYEQIRAQIATCLGESDGYLDSFDENMAFCETTIYATVSEDMADMYQSLKDCACSCQIGDDALSDAAVVRCREEFLTHWGSRLLGALRALHGLVANGVDEDAE